MSSYGGKDDLLERVLLPNDGSLESGNFVGLGVSGMSSSSVGSGDVGTGGGASTVMSSLSTEKLRFVNFLLRIQL